MSHAGRIVWRELVTPNIAVARDFYTRLFGWQSAAMAMPGSASDIYLDTWRRDPQVQKSGGRDRPPVAGVEKRPLPGGLRCRACS